MYAFVVASSTLLLNEKTLGLHQRIKRGMLLLTLMNGAQGNYGVD